MPIAHNLGFPPLGAARASVTGRNPLLFTSYFGYDPEVSNCGQQAIVRSIDLGPYR